MQPIPDEIYLGRDGSRSGPYRMEQVRDMVARGTYTVEDWAWYPGAAQWVALRNVPGFAVGAAPPPAPYLAAPARAAYDAPPRYAGFWIRLGALVIDALVLLIPLFVLESVLLPAETGDPAADLGRDLLALGLSVFVQWAYRAAMHASEWQATIGKHAVGIRVTDLHGRRISFGHATGRYLAEALSGLTFGFGYLMAGFTEHKQALHDKVAGTRVVYR